MICKTEPSIPQVEEKLSGYAISKQDYKEALDLLEEENFYPKSIILKRMAIPPFAISVPLKIVADFDPQLDDADMMILLGEND